MQTVVVKASGEYKVLLAEGLLAQAGEWIRREVGEARVMLVTDDIVNGLYADEAERSLREAGYPVSRFVFPNGEASKNINTLSALLEQLGRENYTRRDLIVALGGGVTGDLAGFAAAVYARGMRFVQMPTTLLAAVDSSVGGKTAVDLAAGKNLAGAFHQPSLVLCDTAILTRLPDRIRAQGMAEVIKGGVLGDRTLFEMVENGLREEDMTEAVRRCVALKARVVEEDEFDTGVRQLLNLGHTAGHAVEQCSDFTIPHGEAVAIGMVLAARMARKSGRADLVERIEKACLNNGLPIRCPFGARQMMEIILRDKKREGAGVRFILPEEIGRCERVFLPMQELETLLEAACEEQERRG